MLLSTKFFRCRGEFKIMNFFGKSKSNEKFHTYEIYSKNVIIMELLVAEQKLQRSWNCNFSNKANPHQIVYVVKISAFLDFNYG